MLRASSAFFWVGEALNRTAFYIVNDTLKYFLLLYSMRTPLPTASECARWKISCTVGFAEGKEGGKHAFFDRAKRARTEQYTPKGGGRDDSLSDQPEHIWMEGGFPI